MVLLLCPYGYNISNLGCHQQTILLLHNNISKLTNVKKLDTYGDFASKIKQLVGNGGLNLLINNAGVTTKFTKLSLVKEEQLMDNFTVNTVAPIILTKAALNAATKSMSLDLKNNQILVACMHPGWVRTDMGGKNAPLDVDSSINGIFNTINKLGEGDSGKFLQYDGSELPW
ncbi:C-factor [Papilio machaon]|uniref:C-factor n=1 Tax=Papilio machaon TaxID=76193 RepID=A0A194QWP2_PAPMA|nr:C-factor [Papilio machaon]